jgi:hypothetical protein
MTPLIDLDDPGEYVRPRLKVYLACSLTTDDNRVLKKAVLAGTERTFLEAGIDVHNPGRHTPPGSFHSPTQVYFEDLHHTISADLIFFVRLGKSIGLGLEAQIGADVFIPWGDARLDGDSYKLSPLLHGLCNAGGLLRGTVSAKEPEQFYSFLAKALRNHVLLGKLFAAKRARDSAQALVDQMDIGRFVRVHRLVHGLSIEEVGKLTDIDPCWIRGIESNPRYVSKLTIIQVQRLCETLRIQFGASIGRDSTSWPSVISPVGIRQDVLAEANSLVDYSYETCSPPNSRPTDDDLVTKWRERLAEKHLPCPEYHQAKPASTGAPIRISICPPMSNETPDETTARRLLVEAIRKSFEESATTVAVVEPEFKEHGRQDHGPEIYLNWLGRLQTTDLAVLVLDPPATGVGIMLQLFQNASIPCLCIAKEWLKVSRMVRGLAPTGLAHIEAKSPEYLRQELANWINANGQTIRQSRTRRESAWKSLGGLSIRRARSLAQIVGAPAVPMPLLREEFLQQLTKHEGMIGTLTLLQLAYISQTQNWNIVPGTGGCLFFEPSIAGRLPAGPQRKAKLAAAKSSLANLFNALEDCDPPIAEDAANRAWSAYLNELELDAARKERKTLTRSKQDWLRILRTKDEL